MLKELIKIEQIPAVLWGKTSENLVIAVHGDMSNKADVPIELFAEYAVTEGYQVLSFDLPEHGDRKHEDILCKVQICVEELGKVMQYAKKRSKNISLFANSMGAYFSLLSYHSEVLEHVWFLSPVVDMKRIIENMMSWFKVTPEQLKSEQRIPTPIGQTLYWDYYCYVKEHPITNWNMPTRILYGSEDALCERDTISEFVERFSCELEIVDGAEHYFHTSEQLKKLNEWLRKTPWF